MKRQFSAILFNHLFCLRRPFGVEYNETTNQRGKKKYEEGYLRSLNYILVVLSVVVLIAADILLCSFLL
jgi:hypothetical protein